MIDNAIPSVKKKKPINAFLQWLFPWRGDSLSDIIKKMVFIASIPLFIYSVNELAASYRERKEEIAYNRTITKTYEPIWNSETDSQDESHILLPDEGAEQEQPRIVQEWAKPLLERNSEVVGWIKIPDFCDSDGNEYINYPVLQRKDNTDIDAANNYYLTHDIDQNYYVSGSIFADSMVPIDEDGQPNNIIIYGHHMRKLGTAFTHLAEYKEGVDFLKKYPIIEFNTIYESNQKYIIIGCFVAASNEYQDVREVFDYWRYRNFDDDRYQYDKWISEINLQSWYAGDVTCEADDDYITLSTCSNEVYSMRWVIVAKKLDKEDDIEKIIASYCERPDDEIYFPYIWRNVWGNQKKYLGWSY